MMSRCHNTGILLSILFLLSAQVLFGQTEEMPLLSILQDGKQIIVKDSDTIVLTRKAFSLRFLLQESNLKENRYFSARINFSQDNRNFPVFEGLGIGKTLCFRPGSGLATDRTGHYSAVHISENHHHYIFFGENEVYQRADLVHQMGKENVLLEWKVDKVEFQGKQYSLSRLPLNQLYVFFFIDQNRDEILDEHEYVRLTIKLMP